MRSRNQKMTVIPFRCKWPPWYRGVPGALVLALFLAGFVALILS